MYELLALLAGSMCLGCFVPARFLPCRLPNDKLLHLITFLLLTISTLGMLDDENFAVPLTFALFALGVLIELIQNLIPGRAFCKKDCFFNGLGIVSGFGLWKVLAVLI